MSDRVPFECLQKLIHELKIEVDTISGNDKPGAVKIPTKFGACIKIALFSS